jgi:hypothetical protein
MWVGCAMGCASLPETGARFGSGAAATLDAFASATEATGVEGAAVVTKTAEVAGASTGGTAPAGSVELLGSRAARAAAKGAPVRSIAGAPAVTAMGSDRSVFGAALADRPRVACIPAATPMVATRMRIAATYGTRFRRRAGAPGHRDSSAADETFADEATARGRVVCASRPPVSGVRAASGVGGLSASC